MGTIGEVSNARGLALYLLTRPAVTTSDRTKDECLCGSKMASQAVIIGFRV